MVCGILIGPDPHAMQPSGPHPQIRHRLSGLLTRTGAPRCARPSVEGSPPILVRVGSMPTSTNRHIGIRHNRGPDQEKNAAERSQAHHRPPGPADGGAPFDSDGAARLVGTGSRNRQTCVRCGPARVAARRSSWAVGIERSKQGDDLIWSAHDRRNIDMTLSLLPVMARAQVHHLPPRQWVAPIVPQRLHHRPLGTSPMDSSPVRTVKKSCPASSPAISRIPVRNCPIDGTERFPSIPHAFSGRSAVWRLRSRPSDWKAHGIQTIFAATMGVHGARPLRPGR